MRVLLSLILTLYCLPALSQSNSFTGKIIYEYRFLNPASGDDMTNVMKQYFGQEQHYYVNIQNYKAYDEKGELRQLYNSKSNTYYFLNPANGQLMKLDAANKTSEVVSVIHSDETKEILGKECKKLIIKTESDETIYWYNPDIAMDSENFKDHNVGNWNTYMKESNGALPLKFRVKSQNYVWISTAVNLKRVDLNQEDFNIDNETKEN